MKELNILLLAGGSGSGKTFIRDMLCSPYNEFTKSDDYRKQQLQFHKPLQTTTRDKRVDESPISYMFINNEDYDELSNNNELTCRTHFNEKYYGTLIDNLVFGSNVYNIIVASKEGINDVKDNLYGMINTKYNTNTISNPIDVNIKTALVLSEIDEKIINSHNERTNDFVEKEILGLISQEFDFYIPNYKNNRATPKILASILGINLKNENEF